MEDIINENNLGIAQLKESAERYRSSHARLVKSLGDPFCNKHCIPELMREYTARNAAKASEAVGERVAAMRILESENAELSMTIAERRLNGMKVDSPKDAHDKCLLDPEWKMADDDHSHCL